MLPQRLFVCKSKSKSELYTIQILINSTLIDKTLTKNKTGVILIKEFITIISSAFFIKQVTFQVERRASNINLRCDVYILRNIINVRLRNSLSIASKSAG